MTLSERNKLNIGDRVMVDLFGYDTFISYTEQPSSTLNGSVTKCLRVKYYNPSHNTTQFIVYRYDEPWEINVSNDRIVKKNK